MARLAKHCCGAASQGPAGFGAGREAVTGPLEESMMAQLSQRPVSALSRMAVEVLMGL